MSSQKLTVLKTQDLIKVISNSYESPYKVLSIRRRCLRAITKASFKQTDVFTLYVSYFCDRFTAVPTAKQNTTPVIHVNWERHQTSSTALWHEVHSGLISTGVCDWAARWSSTDAVWFWTAWSSSLVCKSWPISVFTLIHCCLCLHSSLYLKQAELSCSFSATPCFIFAVRHIHSRHLPTPSRNLGLRLRLLGISVACFHQSFDLFVTGRCLSYMVFMPTSPHLLFLLKHHRVEQSSSLLSKPNRNVSLGIILSFVFASWAMVAKINQPTNHYQMTPSTTE